MVQNRLKYNACHWFMNFIGQENQTKANDPKPKTREPQQRTVAMGTQEPSAALQQLSLLFLPPLSQNAKFKSSWAWKIKEA